MSLELLRSLFVVLSGGGETLLMASVHSGDARLVEECVRETSWAPQDVLNAGAEISKTDFFGNTPLHVPASKVTMEHASCLALAALETAPIMASHVAMADLGHVICLQSRLEWKQPAQVAAAEAHEEVADLLLQRGADESVEASERCVRGIRHRKEPGWSFNRDVCTWLG